MERRSEPAPRSARPRGRERGVSEQASGVAPAAVPLRTRRQRRYAVPALRRQPRDRLLYVHRDRTGRGMSCSAGGPRDDANADVPRRHLRVSDPERHLHAQPGPDEAPATAVSSSPGGQGGRLPTALTAPPGRRGLHPVARRDQEVRDAAADLALLVFGELRPCLRPRGRRALRRAHPGGSRRRLRRRRAPPWSAPASRDGSGHDRAQRCSQDSWGTTCRRQHAASRFLWTLAHLVQCERGDLVPSQPQNPRPAVTSISH
jgi:hypothetical protein